MTLHRHLGFSLLEVLVAFAVAGLCLAILFEIFGRGASTTNLGRDYARAVAVAESQLALSSTLLQGLPDPPSGIIDGRYRWSVSATDHPGPGRSRSPAHVILRDIRVEVAWDSPVGVRRISLQTLKPVPST